MQRAPTPEQSRGHTIRYLVIGYNGCAFTVNGTHPDYLSIPLIQFASQAEYEAFYACTSRCLTLVTQQKKDIQEGRIKTIPGKPDCTYPCYKVTTSFVKATQIPSEGISTLDDVCFQNAYEAYPKVLSPLEHNWEYSATPCASWDDIKVYGRNKNFQLLQIAQHIASKHPDDAELSMTFVDDKVAVTNAAKTIPQDPQWPKNVDLSVYSHHATDDNAPVTLVASGLLRKQSLFANHPVTRSAPPLAKSGYQPL